MRVGKTDSSQWDGLLGDGMEKGLETRNSPGNKKVGWEVNEDN